MRHAALMLLLWAAPLSAADPPVAKLSGPAAVKAGDPIILNPSGSTGTLEFGVATGPGPAPIVTLKSDDGHTVIGFGTAAAAGTYQFYVVAWGENVPNGRPAHAFAFWTVQVGDVPPAPGPGPTPVPVPSWPKPDDPEPDPFGAATATAVGPLRVLIVFESADVQRLPAPYITALYAKDVTNYLNAHCAKGPDGAPMVRHYDKDIDLSAESKVWQDALRRANQKIAAYKPFSLPKTDPDYRPMVWLMVGNGKNGYEGPLPANKDTYLNLLRKYGGQ